MSLLSTETRMIVLDDQKGLLMSLTVVTGDVTVPAVVRDWQHKQ